MTITCDIGRVRDAYRLARQTLLDAREPQGWWLGQLSSSALSTATATSALSMVDRHRYAGLIDGGLAWLLRTQNADGGWGDTTESPSNVPTTLLVRAAAAVTETGGPMVDRAEAYLNRTAGHTPQERLQTVCGLYGDDRSFAVPILTNLALVGQADWRDVPPLPFELACLPHRFLNALPLRVVSYALPALVAIGQLLHRRRPTRMLPLRWLRHLAVGPALGKLTAVQPSSGGFLEAVPITAFVIMALAASVGRDHPVAVAGLQFLCTSVRADGSWPIDVDLSCWLTSQAMIALSGDVYDDDVDLEPTLSWLLGRQHTHVHPYTAASPGGWAWTHGAGGVPDADDTAAALIALAGRSQASAPVASGGRQPPGSPGATQESTAATQGVRWLLDLQNNDGGWPTFCRGWGRLPFDSSGADLTAHALRALERWPEVAPIRRRRRAQTRGLRYLAQEQADDGSWNALWFGNQATPDQTNPVLGTGRVLPAYRELNQTDAREARRGCRYLIEAQHDSGGWGGAAGVSPSIEETAVALEALTGWAHEPAVAASCGRAADWLAARILAGDLDQPAPIGLYFARLWYSERLYPVIWSLTALGTFLGEPRAFTTELKTS